MKKRIIHFFLILSFLFLQFPAFSQVPEHMAAKRETRKNMTVKEWNTDARSKTRWLDRVTTYDQEGRKIEETEYARYGQKWRQTYEYGANGRIVREVLYDDRDKPSLIRKYEYDPEGRKARQFNYAPNGKLQTTKVFEYVQ